VVRQVEQDEASRSDSRVTRRSSGTPRKSSRPVASGPHTQAVGFSVVGRSGPTSATSRLEIWLNIEDLPDPVPPTSATTAWSTPSSRRSRSSAASSCVRAATAGSMRSPAAATASVRPVMRSRRAAPTASVLSNWVT
jgi:hypothetical protein